MNKINNNDIIKESELKNNLNKYKEGSDYSVSPTEENGKKIYTFHNNELRSWFGNSRPVSVREENYKDENLSYWGRFEQGENYTASVQTWNYGENHKFESGIHPFVKKQWSDENWNHTYESGRFINRGSSIHRNNELAMRQRYLKDFQKEKHFWETRLIEENNPEYCLKKHGKNWQMSHDRNELVENIKGSIEELESKIQYEKGWLDKNSNNLLIGENPDGNNQSKLIKENQDLRKQLAEVQQQLTKVSEELKNLKDSLTDKDKEELAREFIEIQEQNDKLVSNPNASAAEIKEHTVKAEDLGKKVNARNVNTETFSTNSPDGKDNSNLLIGGGVTLISILIVGFGYYLVKRKKNK